MEGMLSSDWTHLIMIEGCCQELQAIVDASKQAWAGISVDNLQTHILTSQEAFSQVTATEASRAAKKSKGKGKAPEVDGEDPTKDPTFIQSHTDQN